MWPLINNATFIKLAGKLAFECYYVNSVVSAKQYTAITLKNVMSGLTKVFLNEANSMQEP